MKNIYKQKREQGFTIIEVMIVLAIAAVILLIVLLAVPALQRSNRNTQRNNDAGQIAAAVNTCLANNNGTPSKCATISNTTVDMENNGANPPVLTKTGQITGVTFANTGGSYATPGVGTTTSAVVSYYTKCNGALPLQAASTKAFAILWQNEASGGLNTPRCVDG